MKRILIILLCWVSFANAQQTSFRVDCNDGNDSTNDGTTWPGFLTLTAAEADGDFAEGDTIVFIGKCTEIFAPTQDGASGNKCVLIDSVSFVDGFTPAQPDTVWLAEINGQDTRARCIALNADDFWDIIHVKTDSSTGEDLQLSSADGNKIQQSWLRGRPASGSARSVRIVGSSLTDSLISNVFHTQGVGGRGILMDNSTSTTHYIVNNTFIGDYRLSGFDLNASAGNLVFRNNLIHNTSAVSADFAFDVSNVTAVSDFNNNLYYAPSVTNTWSFGGASFDLLATWVDSVDNHDADGATNSLNSDPALQNPNNTAHILNTSPAFEAGTDLGFGTDIGYYQVIVAAVAATPATKKAVRPRWWND